MADEQALVVPMEFGLQSDGTIRLVIHITDVQALPQILRDIGNHTTDILEALSAQMEEFITEKGIRK